MGSNYAFFLSWRRLFAACVFCTAAAITLPAQTYTTLYNFCSQSNCTDGALPEAALVQGTDGNLYGTTLDGGNGVGPQCAQCGTAFKITPNGTLTTLYNFCSQSNCTDGAAPKAAVTQGATGNFYGTASIGGANGVGTVFKLTPNGTLTTLYTFCSQSNCTDGYYPFAGLIQGTDGNFYGTTVNGGATDWGTVFKITPGGTLTTVYSFCSQPNCADGEEPRAAVVQGTNGNFYGTASQGGITNSACPDGCGTVFEITSGRTLTTLHSFASTDGAYPVAGLIQATDGNFYGTTEHGGAYGAGTVFKITANGSLTTLYSFCPQGGVCTDGADPFAGLVQGTDGQLYGTTSGGGINYGTIFKITTSGTLTTIYTFPNTGGIMPEAGLTQDTNGKFYGTTSEGGDNDNAGTVFSLSEGLGAFVETQPTSGKVGATVKILGTNLTGATSVTFNGTAAVFKVVSASLITTAVPSGATTGKVKVVTPGRTLTSNVVFRVLL